MADITIAREDPISGKLYNTKFHDNGDGTYSEVVVSSGGGGGAVTVADAADVAEGATTDAAIITDTNGTLSGKLRGLVKWAFERMPASLGQKAMAASLPVAIASDQSAVTVTSGAGIATTLPTAQVSVGTAATLIRAANTARKGIILTNAGASPVYVGQDNTVTTTTGHYLPAGASMALANYNGALYGIVATGTVTVTYAAEV